MNEERPKLSDYLSFQSNKLISLSGDYNGMSMSAANITAIGSLDGAGQNGGDNNVAYQIVGQPLGVFYLPHCKGLVKNENGSYFYDIEDLDHNGNVDLSDGGDRYIAGQATPKVILVSHSSFRLSPKFPMRSARILICCKDSSPEI